MKIIWNRKIYKLYLDYNIFMSYIQLLRKKSLRQKLGYGCFIAGVIFRKILWKTNAITGSIVFTLYIKNGFWNMSCSVCVCMCILSFSIFYFCGNYTFSLILIMTQLLKYMYITKSIIRSYWQGSGARHLILHWLEWKLVYDIS